MITLYFPVCEFNVGKKIHSSFDTLLYKLGDDFQVTKTYGFKNKAIGFWCTYLDNIPSLATSVINSKWFTVKVNHYDIIVKNDWTYICNKIKILDVYKESA